MQLLSYGTMLPAGSCHSGSTGRCSEQRAAQKLLFARCWNLKLCWMLLNQRGSTVLIPRPGYVALRDGQGGKQRTGSLGQLAQQSSTLFGA